MIIMSERIDNSIDNGGEKDLNGNYEKHIDSKEEVIVSSLPKTWILDLDGTLVKHNGYLIDGHDTLLDGVIDLFMAINPKDLVIIVTSREKKYSKQTVSFLQENGLRYNQIIWGAPYGERIIINDKKPSGLITAIAVNKERNSPLNLRFVTDTEL